MAHRSLIRALAIVWLLLAFAVTSHAQSSMTLGDAVRELREDIRQEIVRIHLLLGPPKACGLPVDRRRYLGIYIDKLRRAGETPRQLRAAELFAAHGTMRFKEIDANPEISGLIKCDAQRRAAYSDRLRRMRAGDFSRP